MSASNVPWLVHVFVAIFFIGMLAVGFLSNKKIANLADYLVGLAGYFGYVRIAAGGFTKDLADPLYYQAAFMGGLASALAYLFVTMIRYPLIKPIQLACELPKR